MAAALLVAAPAADASCVSGAKQVFSQFGDANYYSPLPNGGFESGKTSWATTGAAAVVAGNQPFALSGSGKGTSSLSLPSGSSATSSTFCITKDTPLARFVMRLRSGTAGALRLDAVVGSLVLSLGTVTSNSTTWAPSPQIRVWLTNFALLSPSGEVNIRLRATATSGAWQVDDFFLDPFKKL
jgi:hypothetical protein